MSVQINHVCVTCQSTFRGKAELARHARRKTACTTTPANTILIQDIEPKNNMRELSVLFAACLNILRDGEMLTGDKALRNLAYLLNLRLLEPQFDTTINLDLCAYVPNTYCDDVADNEHARILHFARFSNLAAAPADNLPQTMKSLWDDVLSTHPVTRHVFIRGKGFDIRRQSTYKSLINLINAFDFAAVEEDVLGEAYEDVIKHVMIGKDLGQFFTPPAVKQMMVGLINPQVCADGTIETVFDPAMGTGGFLITCLRHLAKSARQKSIHLNWDFISSVGLGGREAEPDTYQLAVSNMLIASGHMFNVLEKGDSIRSPITNTYDIVLANPPFGISGLMYDDITHPLRDTYLPIRTNSAVPLFVQAIIHMLNIGGRCAIVLPDGQDLFGGGKTLVAVREYLVKTCDLREVIYLPAKTFTHTGIKTCVLYFHKHKCAGQIVATTIRYAADAGRETGRTYSFTAEHATDTTAFYNFTPSSGVKQYLGHVCIAAMAANSYSLYYNDYTAAVAPNYNTGVLVMALGDICNIDYGERIVKSRNTEGAYPVYGSGRVMFTTNKFNRDGYNILIGRFALSEECVRITTTPLFLNDSGLSVRPKDPTRVLPAYMGYYLCEHREKVYECSRGTAQRNLDMAKFATMPIPVPPIEQQQSFIHYMYTNDVEISRLSDEITRRKNSARDKMAHMLYRGA